MSFFDNLVSKVKKRVEQRKQDRQSQLHEKDILTARLRAANEQMRPALEQELSGMISSMQSTGSLLELRNYVADFEAVLLHPEEYLRLDQTAINLDSMG